MVNTGCGGCGNIVSPSTRPHRLETWTYFDLIADWWSSSWSASTGVVVVVPLSITGSVLSSDCTTMVPGGIAHNHNQATVDIIVCGQRMQRG